MPPAKRTLGQWLVHASSQLAQVSELPTREARWLLSHVTGLDEHLQRQHDSQTMSTAQQQRLDALLARRVAGEPLAYVLGSQPFWTLELEVTPAVLIPRADTEVLVECALQLLPPTSTARIADLGTGSGAIALALAQERPQLDIWATDLSAAALSVAQHNANKLGLRVQFVQGDWCAALPDQAFELIISNPPYIAEHDPHLEASVIDHEPRLALIAANEGLAALSAIIHTAPAHLAPNGHVLLEHGWQQAAQVRNLMQTAGYVDITSHTDLAGHERVTAGRYAGKSALPALRAKQSLRNP